VKNSTSALSIAHLSIVNFLVFTFSVYDCYSQIFPKREFRGVWVATVANIDWPSTPSLTSDEQRKEFIRLLEMHKANGMNVVIVQVRPSADAFYPSRYEPWSKWLTGKLGRGPSPYYDPLKFMIEEAHQRGLEFHAWFNPYRALMNVEKNGIDSASLVFQKPEWFVKYGSNMYFNPGLPEARRHTVNVIMDVVHRYDVDAVHFDDYFYPYKIQGLDFPDSATYAAQKESFASRDDWRRNNVDRLIKELSDSIRSVKPHVQFGISPFGVWRNQEKDSTGSATKAGQTCYDDLYADVLKWQKEKWIDYVLPQIYWSIGFKVADYKIIAEWWNKNNYGVPVYIGQAAYRVGNHTDENWKRPDQLPSQIRLNRSLNQIQGSAFFSSKSFQNNSLGMNDSLKVLYTHCALTPQIKKSQSPLRRDYAIQFLGREDGIQLLWEETNPIDSLSSHCRYIVYRFDKKEKINLADPSKIIKLLPAQNNNREQSFVDITAKKRKRYQYVITSLNRFNGESDAAFGYSVVNRKNYWKVFPRE
jgi:uncharacterized lipoprotein YddW (UPF0748 family)